MSKVVTSSELELVKAELEAFKMLHPTYFREVYEFFTFMDRYYIPFRYGCLLFQGWESKKADKIDAYKKIQVKELVSNLTHSNYEGARMLKSLLDRHRLKGYDNLAEIVFNIGR
jgi:hypothetical protein